MTSTIEGKARTAPVREGDDTERVLGRALALGLPIVSVVSAGVVMWVASIGPALLVLASGAVLGTIALLWASLRTLSGDAPLPAGLEAVASHRHVVTRLSDDKRRVLRALKDLESEHALGKIDDADYQTLAARYREDAKAMMRHLDEDIAPLRAEAERLAREYVGGQGGHGSPLSPPVEPPPAPPAAAAKTTRIECTACHASNEADAAFCKQCGGALRKDE